MSAQPAVVPIALHDGRVRVVIENVAPVVDGGRFPIKRVVGDDVLVQADCFADGHDAVACELLWRHLPADATSAAVSAPAMNGRAPSPDQPDQPEWNSVRMSPLGNDRWQSQWRVDALGVWEYTVAAWVDPFLSWRSEFARRVDRDDLVVAALAGVQLIRAAAARAGAGVDGSALLAWALDLESATASSGRLGDVQRLGLSEAGAQLACRHPDRSQRQVHPQTFAVSVERERARFSAWYEFFPRSASGDPDRHGTFADCEAWLPYVRRMGFDIVYFPPIHPIGRSRRKGRDNTLSPREDDVGSPWAIGASEGGHDAILPQLGTLEQFRHLLKAAADQGLEIALDIAFQCSPDHPWVREHPEWFRRRADGAIQYAENPPKKYQDIYPFDFETEHWRALWLALAQVFEHWADLGVRVFRVDNPHTKSFGFWEWAIARIRRSYPDAIFLSEAFTRPRVMHRLAKAGFSQSYTYFTWRNSKRELTEYFTELTQGPGREYLRPNAWPNTPDILPGTLQYGGRAAFQARLALAATLSANYGIYGPAFELLEHEAVQEGSEEYRGSEKYERRVWDRDRPESLADFIAVLNRARRENPALQRDDGLRFLSIDNDQLIAYAKSSADGTNIVVCVVNLDFAQPQSGWLRIDPALYGLQPDQVYQMHDLISGARFLWQGERNFVSLDPARSPLHLMRLRAQRRRENDFDYFV